jgi:hypothetical protein
VSLLASPQAAGQVPQLALARLLGPQEPADLVAPTWFPQGAGLSGFEVRSRRASGAVPPAESAKKPKPKPKASASKVCHKCGKPGHIASECADF